MTEPIERVSRSYRIHELWYDWDQNPDRSNGGKTSFKPFPLTQTMSLPLLQYEFDRFAQRIAEQLAAVLTAAESLKQAAVPLKDASAGSVFSQRTIGCEQAHAVTVLAKDSARVQSYIIQTDRVARKQRNRGFAWKASEAFPLAGSLCELELRTRSAWAKRLTLAFGPADTNEQALARMQRAVSDAGYGVTARLLHDHRENRVTLELESDETGASRAFTVTDTRGIAAALTGIDRTTQAAENAIYTINGGTVVSSSSHEVTLDEGRLALTLNEAAKDPVRVTVNPDRGAIKKQLGELISRCNEVRISLREANEILNPEASRDLLNDLPLHALEELGILELANGHLRLNETNLEAQIHTRFDQLTATLTDGSGLIAYLFHAAERLGSSSPEALLNKQNGSYRALINYAYGPEKRLRSYLPVPITGFLMNYYS